MVDADNLKVINDTYGHDKGDIYLKKISGVLKHLGSRKNIVARFGGDEFVLFLYEYDTETELKNTINALEYIQNHSTAHLDKNLNERGARHGNRFVEMNALVREVLETPMNQTLGVTGCEDRRLELLCLLFDYSRKGDEKGGK